MTQVYCVFSAEHVLERVFVTQELAAAYAARLGAAEQTSAYVCAMPVLTEIGNVWGEPSNGGDAKCCDMRGQGY